MEEADIKGREVWRWTSARPGIYRRFREDVNRGLLEEQRHEDLIEMRMIDGSGLNVGRRLYMGARLAVLCPLRPEGTIAVIVSAARARMIGGRAQQC